MTFLARLFGFAVIMIMFSAVALSLVEKVPSEIVDLASRNLTTKPDLPLEEAVTNAIDNVVLPSSLKSSGTEFNLEKVEVAEVNGLKELIYTDGQVVVVLNNQFLKNPFIKGDGTVVVILNGYDETHLFSTGAEIGGSEFVYPYDDFMRATEASASSFWVLKK
jgi:hypothetical protein